MASLSAPRQASGFARRAAPHNPRAAAAGQAGRRQDSRLDRLQTLSDRLDRLIAAETLGTTSYRQYDVNADEATDIGTALRAVFRDAGLSAPTQSDGQDGGR